MATGRYAFFLSASVSGPDGFTAAAPPLPATAVGAAVVPAPAVVSVVLERIGESLVSPNRERSASASARSSASKSSSAFDAGAAAEAAVSAVRAAGALEFVPAR